jgi:hypothetical protein
MYNIPSSVSSQCCSSYCIYTILTPQEEPLTTPIIEEINIIVLVLGLTRLGIWNRAHVLPRLRWTRWPLQRWGCWQISVYTLYVFFLYISFESLPFLPYSFCCWQLKHPTNWHFVLLFHWAWTWHKYILNTAHLTLETKL